MTHSLFIRNQKLSEEKKVSQRRNFLASQLCLTPEQLQHVFDANFPVEEVGKKNCENLVGSVEIPLGVAGPVTAEVEYINKSVNHHKKNSKKMQTFFVPLATTEGALVASIHRGLKALDLSGVCVTVKKMGMSRSVVFEADSHGGIEEFILFFKKNESEFAQHCESTSSHLKYISLETFTRGKIGFFRFVFDTDEAMGMNMVTIALSHAWQKFQKRIPATLQISLLTLSGNVCTDKKDSAINRMYGRGYAVVLEAKLPAAVLKKTLKVGAQQLVKIHTVKNLIGSNVAGSFSQNMHVANALAAIYTATGQDIAHTVAGSEASVHFEIADEASVYATLTLPNVSVGTVGGGTWLPKQLEARKLVLKDSKQISAQELAAAVGLGCFAGEISGLSALATHTLASAHQKLGRS